MRKRTRYSLLVALALVIALAVAVWLRKLAPPEAARLLPESDAIIYVNLRTFALDALVAVGLDGKRFQLLIGLGFLLIVLFSPDGVLGLWARWRNRMRNDASRADARDRRA